MPTEKEKSVLALRISSARESLEMTQLQLGIEVAKLVPERDDDYGQQLVSKWENDDAKPTLAALAALATVLRCTTDWLLGRSAYRTGAPPLPVGEFVVDDALHRRLLRGAKLPEDETWYIQVEASCRVVKVEEYTLMQKALDEKARDR